MKSVFITGAAGGIGEALAVRCQEAGWQVFAGYRSTPPDNTRWSGRPQVWPVPCDITSREDIVRAAAFIREKTGGGLDLLINNAGYSGNAGVIEAPVLSEYHKIFDVNFWGPFQVAEIMIPLLKNAQGRIINTISASVFLTIPMGSAYPVAKTAMKALSHHMRLEMAPFGVQVTALDPGGVETPMTALGAEAGEAQWQSIPAALRDEYRRYFCDGASAVGNNFRFFTPDVFADKMYRQVVCAKHLKPAYLIGPGVAPLPWLHRLLPTRQVLNIWARMFAAKRTF